MSGIFKSRTFLCKLLILRSSMVSREIWINMHSRLFSLEHVISKLHSEQGRRNRGARPPKFCQVPYFREQSALFLARKMSLRLYFSPKGHFWKLEFILFPENFFHFREKYHKSAKCFGYVRKIFLRWPIPTPHQPLPPPANISGKKFLDALFYSKSTLQSPPPPPPTFTSFLCPWLWTMLLPIQIVT